MWEFNEEVVKNYRLAESKGEAPANEKNIYIAIENPIRVLPAIMIVVSGYPVIDHNMNVQYQAAGFQT